MLHRSRSAWTLSVLMILMYTTTWGQAPTPVLFDSLSISGGFFNATMRYAEVVDRETMLIGFGGGVLVNERLGIGLAGAWSAAPIKNNAYRSMIDTTTTANLDGLALRYGYGGVLITPVIGSRSAVHLAAPVLIGMGGISYGYPQPAGNNGSAQRIKTEGQAYFVLEPGLELEVNVLKALRIGAGASYLLTSPLDLPGTKSDALHGIQARLTMTAIFR